MTLPLISVVLPLYNREKYIKESIESILNQTVRDFELLIIDDASTDGSVEVVKSFKDQRIKLFTNTTNKGVATAINIGFREAKGKYIARMDSDDISFPKRFEKQLKAHQEYPEIIVCGSWILKDNGELLKFKETHEEILVDMLNRCALSMGASFINRQKMDGLLLKEGFRYGEDYEFWSRLISKGEFYNVQEPLLHYRSNDSQLSVFYKEAQIKLDLEIQLTFLKGIPYDKIEFRDDLIKNILGQERYFAPLAFKEFLAWQKQLKIINKKNRCFSSKEFNKYILKQRRDLILNLFFKKNRIGLGRKWRIKVFFYLKWNEMRYIVRQKIKEKIKLFMNG